MPVSKKCRLPWILVQFMKLSMLRASTVSLLGLPVPWQAEKRGKKHPKIWTHNWPQGREACIWFIYLLIVTKTEPDALFLPGYLVTISCVLNKQYSWSFWQSGEEHSWTPFGHRPSQVSHLFTPFLSTSILSAGQLLTQEVPSTKKFAEQRRRKKRRILIK